jgi:hypothetical protein
MGISRRGFLGLAPAAALIASSPARAFTMQQKVDDDFPRQDKERVREVVGASHGNIERVKELLKETPELAKAAWDWGFGDWETALGAASHVGRRDIAELLMAHGARPDIFTFALMDHVAAVKAAIEAQPSLAKMHGPHGIPLMSHAENAESAKVVDYLKSVPGANKRAPSLEVSDKSIYMGKYELDLEVLQNSRGDLAIRRGAEGSGQILNRVEEHGFAPSGASSVRVRFTVQGGKAVSLAVHEPMPTAVARRV